MIMPRMKLFAFAGALTGLVLSLPALGQDQQVFAGRLGDSLRAEAAQPGVVAFRSVAIPRGDLPGAAPAHRNLRRVRVQNRDFLGVTPQEGDEFFRGMLRLPRGKDGLRYPALLVRHSDGESMLYVDPTPHVRFEPTEGVPFRPVEGGSDPRFTAVAAFRVELPAGGFRPVEMKAWLMRDGGPESRGDEVRIAYTSVICVAGRARLPEGMLSMCFEYDPATEQASLANGLEWVDWGGGGTQSGRRILRVHGEPPAFRVGNLTLRAATVDVKTRAFVLVSVPDGGRARK